MRRGVKRPGCGLCSRAPFRGGMRFKSDPTGAAPDGAASFPKVWVFGRTQGRQIRRFRDRGSFGAGYSPPLRAVRNSTAQPFRMGDNPTPSTQREEARPAARRPHGARVAAPRLTDPAGAADPTTPLQAGEAAGISGRLPGVGADLFFSRSLHARDARRPLASCCVQRHVQGGRFARGANGIAK